METSDVAELRAELSRVEAQRDEANRKANAAQTLNSNQRVMLQQAEAKIKHLEACIRSNLKCNDDMERAMLAAEALNRNIASHAIALKFDCRGHIQECQRCFAWVLNGPDPQMVHAVDCPVGKALNPTKGA